MERGGSVTPGETISYEPSLLPICPFARHQANEQQEDDRHIPQVHLIHDGDAALTERDVLGKAVYRRRRVKAAAGLSRDALEQGGAHLRIEELLSGVALRVRPHERRLAAVIAPSCCAGRRGRTGCRRACRSRLRG